MNVPFRNFVLACIVLCVAAGEARSADKVVLGMIGAGSTVHWPTYIATEKGFFAKRDLIIDVVIVPSNAAMQQQIAAGALDIGVSAGSPDPIRAVDKGASLALIRVVGNAAPYVLIGKPGLKSIADLKGKIVSVGADNDITTFYFERMMAANGLKKDDYVTIPAGVAAARFAALKAGVVDAAIVLPPLNFQAQAAGFVTLGLAADYVKDVPFTGMAVHRRWATANTQAAKRVLTATDKSVAWLADPLHRDEAIDLLIKAARSSREDAEGSYDYLRRIEYFEPSSKVSRAKVSNLVQIEQRAGTVSPAFDVDRLFMPGLTDLMD